MRLSVCVCSRRSRACLVGAARAICLASHQHRPVTCAVVPRCLWAALPGSVRSIDWGGGASWWLVVGGPDERRASYHPASIVHTLHVCPQRSVGGGGVARSEQRRRLCARTGVGWWYFYE